MNNCPIGIFDSGIGGLTVAKSVTHLLPKESIIYFGDTAHFPYGDKSTAAIQAYSIKICDFLLQHQCKVILIACNSASTAAYELVKEYVGSRAKIFNVIDPTVTFVGQNFGGKTIGLIGTQQTVNSEVYKRKIESLGLNIQLKSLATRLLAPMIEEGFFDNTISESTIQTYLSDSTLADISALILACTHYPLILPQIERFYQKSVVVIDGSLKVAASLKEYLQTNNLEKETNEPSYRRFFVSDYTKSFENSTSMFFGQAIELELHKLWD
jgi:glutamate racemase